MCLKSRHVWDLVVSFFGNSFGKELISKDYGLWESIHALVDFDKHHALICYLDEVVLFNRVVSELLLASSWWFGFVSQNMFHGKP
jgi:hypothetical protein